MAERTILSEAPGVHGRLGAARMRSAEEARRVRPPGNEAVLDATPCPTSTRSSAARTGAATPELEGLDAAVAKLNETREHAL